MQRVALVFQISFHSEMIAFIGVLKFLDSHIPTNFYICLLLYILYMSTFSLVKKIKYWNTVNTENIYGPLNRGLPLANKLMNFPHAIYDLAF